MFIQVVQDVVCPWCRIGKHHLDAALGHWMDQGGAPVDVQWFPYLLDPIEPGTRHKFRKRLIERKGMRPDQVDGMFERVTSVGAKSGIAFNFDKIEYAVSTLPAHQLIALVPAARQSAAIDGLHDAYFEQGKDIENVDVLIGITTSAGITAELLSQLRLDLENDTRRDDVEAMIAQAQAASISSVPFFIVDGKLSLSGAQPPETILAAIRKISMQEEPVVTGGPSAATNHDQR